MIAELGAPLGQGGFLRTQRTPPLDPPLGKMKREGDSYLPY